MKINTESMVYKFIWVFLTCYFAYLFKFPMIVTLGVGAIFCLYFLIKQKIIRIDAGLCFVSIAMLGFSAAKFGARGLFVMMPYVPVVIYVLATYLGAKNRLNKESELNLIYIIYCLIFGHAIYGILNAYMFFAGTGIEGTRYWVDFWTREMTPGTKMTPYFLVSFAVVFPSVMYFLKRKIANTMVILLTVFFIYVSLVTRTRTTILVLGLVLCAQALLFVVLEWKKIKEVVTPKRILIFGGTALLGLVALILLLKDHPIIVTFINNLGKDGGILNNYRFVAQKQALEQLFDYPFGGYQMQMQLKMAHNVWLDLANAAGLIPFFALVGYTLWTAYELFRFVKDTTFSAGLKLMLFGIYVAYVLYYMVEPALEASIHFMSPWMLVNGLIHGYLSDCGIKLQKEKGN